VGSIRLCTKDDIKVRIGQAKTVTKDNLAMDQLIPAVSAEIEEFIRRFVHKTNYTDVFDVRDKGNLRFVLSAYPVVSITDVRCDLDREFDTASIMNTDTFDFNAEAGLLYFEKGYLYTGFRVLQVNYNGGIATNTMDLQNSNAGLILREAAIKECAFRIKTRDQIGAIHVVAGQLGSVSWPVAQDLQSDVKQMLKPLQRLDYF
jgi:hypothetical protein